MREIKDVRLHQKTVLLRVDMNVPMNGDVRDDQRIKACLPTIHELLRQNAAVVLLSHLGRPPKEEPSPGFSLAPVARQLEKLLARKVDFVNDYLGGVNASPGDVLLCENVRFNAGEKKNDPLLAQSLARLGDVFVMDAFAVAHRTHASTCGVARFAPVSCAGPLLCHEVKALGKARHNPERPVLVIVGGSKISTKFGVLDALSDLADFLIPGGGIANTFLAASGCEIGTSLHEAEWIGEAQKIMRKMRRRKKPLLMPEDVVCAKSLEPSATPEIRGRDQIEEDTMVLDIGPETTKQYTTLIAQAKTILWNGPLGVFEDPRFAAGTRSVAHAIASSPAFSVAGGGDTLAALTASDSAGISYISTGGGAFLEFMKSGQLAALKELECSH